MLQAWAITALCAPIAAVAGGRLSSARTIYEAVDRGLHLIMAVAMVAMSWWVITGGWAVASMVAFGAAAAWYGVRALRALGARSIPFLAHCVLMLTMVWMIAAMPSHAVGHHHESVLWVVLAGIPLVAATISGGVVLVVDGVRSWRLDSVGDRADHAADVAMCTGMVIVSWPMLFA